MPENISELVIKTLTTVGIFLLIILVSFFVIGILNNITSKLVKKSPKIPTVLGDFIISSLKKVYWIIALLIALGTIGVSVVPFITGLGIAGFILGFAFQETLSNLAAGVMLLIYNPFDKGHYIEAAGQAGSVQEIQLAATVLHSPDNKRIVVPNSKLWGSPITNYSVLPTRRLSMEVGIAYGSSIGKAKDVITKVVSENQYTLDDPKPTIELLTMADSALVLVVRPWVNTPDFWSAYWSLNQSLKEALDEAGIEIPFPQRDLHIKGLPEELAGKLGAASK